MKETGREAPRFAGSVRVARALCGLLKMGVARVAALKVMHRARRRRMRARLLSARTVNSVRSPFVALTSSMRRLTRASLSWSPRYVEVQLQRRSSSARSRCAASPRLSYHLASTIAAKSLRQHHSPDIKPSNIICSSRDCPPRLRHRHGGRRSAPDTPAPSRVSAIIRRLPARSPPQRSPAGGLERHPAVLRDWACPFGKATSWRL